MEALDVDAGLGEFLGDFGEFAGLVGQAEYEGFVHDGLEAGVGEDDEGVVGVVGFQGDYAGVFGGVGVDRLDVDVALGEGAADVGDDADLVFDGDDDAAHSVLSCRRLRCRLWV